MIETALSSQTETGPLFVYFFTFKIQLKLCDQLYTVAEECTRVFAPVWRFLAFSELGSWRDGAMAEKSAGEAVGRRPSKMRVMNCVNHHYFNILQKRESWIVERPREREHTSAQKHTVNIIS